MTLTSLDPSIKRIAFIGNSNIGRRNTPRKDFRVPPDLSRGFGGSVASNRIAYIGTMALRHELTVVDIYTGGNDINAKLTLRETFDNYAGCGLGA